MSAQRQSSAAGNRTSSPANSLTRQSPPSSSTSSTAVPSRTSKLGVSRSSPPSANNMNPNSSGRRDYGSSSYQSKRQLEGTDNEYNEVVDEIDSVKNDSVNSSRNALRMLRESEEVGASTLTMLAGQNQKLDKIDSKTTVADLEATKASIKAAELKRLNKNFLVAKFSFSNPFSSSKRKAKKLQDEVDAMRIKEEEQAEAESGTLNDSGAPGIAAAAESSGKAGSKGGDANGRRVGTPSRANRLEHEQNCEMEDEIDSNLDEIGDSLARIRAMGLSMGNSIEESNEKLVRIGERTDKINDSVRRTERKINSIN